jgi:hypothetical protein
MPNKTDVKKNQYHYLNNKLKTTTKPKQIDPRQIDWVNQLLNKIKDK